MLLQQQQRHYDRLHHEKRLADLASGQFNHFGRHERLMLETGSKECLRLIREQGMSTNSVDVRDTEHLAVLDAFETTTNTSSA
ncbi:hypothetical protein HG549_16330 [Pseudomonas sp. SK]|uniref:hypothetical protein n=1 Tax=Pseudomonas sp. SK TaxID=2729423 RepID=UPI0014645453|nr:hypothetical protein [Pseudomonas sp. SK]QJQ21425.1 hypothetical protein HG549_16330 [Pseudomonas sp. SK]